MKRLEGKLAIVTGGGRGIGRAICKKFAQEGAAVWVADLRLESAISCAESICAEGGNANPIQVDVADDASVRAMVEQIAVQESGGIDVLVNNAGIGMVKTLFDTTVEDWDRVMAINVRGIFLCCKHVVPYMLSAGRGTIINMGSCTGQIGAPLQAAYCAAKGAVNQFTKSLALELGPRNIRICAVAPGVADTDMIKSHQQEYGKFDFDMLASVEERQLGGLLRPEDIANMVAFLASEEGRGVHGSVVPVDAGVCAG